MTYGQRKSGSTIVPAKSPNNAVLAAAEAMEGRGGAKANVVRGSTCQTQSWESVSPALDRIQEKVRELVGRHAILAARAGLHMQFMILHRRLLTMVRADEVCRRLMTVAGVGGVDRLTIPDSTPEIAKTPPTYTTPKDTIAVYTKLSPAHYFRHGHKAPDVTIVFS